MCFGFRCWWFRFSIFNSYYTARFCSCVGELRGVVTPSRCHHWISHVTCDTCTTHRCASLMADEVCLRRAGRITWSSAMVGRVVADGEESRGGGKIEWEVSLDLITSVLPLTYTYAPLALWRRAAPSQSTFSVYLYTESVIDSRRYRRV